MERVFQAKKNAKQMRWASVWHLGTARRPMWLKTDKKEDSSERRYQGDNGRREYGRTWAIVRVVLSDFEQEKQILEFIEKRHFKILKNNVLFSYQSTLSFEGGASANDFPDPPGLTIGILLSQRLEKLCISLRVKLLSSEDTSKAVFDAVQNAQQ